MKRKDKESLKALGSAELESEIKKRREELFRIKMLRPFRKEKNPLKQRVLRREIASLMSWMNAKVPYGGGKP